MAKAIDNEKDLLIEKLRREILNLKRNPAACFTEKKPDYYYSLSGFYIVRKYTYFNGLTFRQLELLVVISHYKYFLSRDIIAWNFKSPSYDRVAIELERLGYIIKVEVPGQRYKVKKGWALTQKGRDVEKDYEKFYDEKISDLKNQTAGNKPNSKHRFEDGQYFRRVRIPKRDRREAQGGGELPKRSKKDKLFKDAYPDAKPNDEQA